MIELISACGADKSIRTDGARVLLWTPRTKRNGATRSRTAPAQTISSDAHGDDQHGAKRAARSYYDGMKQSARRNLDGVRQAWTAHGVTVQSCTAPDGRTVHTVTARASPDALRCWIHAALSRPGREDPARAGRTGGGTFCDSRRGKNNLFCAFCDSEKSKNILYGGIHNVYYRFCLF